LKHAVSLNLVVFYLILINKKPPHPQILILYSFHGYKRYLLILFIILLNRNKIGQVELE